MQNYNQEQSWYILFPLNSCSNFGLILVHLLIEGSYFEIHIVNNCEI